MMGMGDKVSDSRALAYRALERVRSTQAFANEVIDSVIDGSDASLPDRAYATKLVLGVVASAGSLDDVINRYLDKPGTLKGKLRTALRIAAYEIIYLGKDGYAAVDQCVEMVKSIQPRAKGLANAVMRRLADESGAFPFGDPNDDIEAFSLQQAFPEWLAVLAMKELGDASGREFVVANNLPAPIYIHMNGILCDAKGVDVLKSIDGDLEEVTISGTVIPGCYKLSNPRAVADPRFLEMVSGGKVLVSDASAQLICLLACKASASVSSLDPTCLELCAGRGTKTVLLQSTMSMLGCGFRRYVAVDDIAFKMEILSRRATEYGARVDESICADARDLGKVIADEAFDLVFLDAPCSGIGTMRRHPEIRWRVDEKAISANASLDLELIMEASRHVSAGGVLVYSTCTITSQENEETVNAFLESGEGSHFELLSINGKPHLRTLLQKDGHDAHFCSMLKRKELI